MTTHDKIVILFSINIYGFHLVLRWQLCMLHASLQERYSVKMSAGAALRRALMATCMMRIPYVDSDRNFPPPRSGAARRCMYLRRIIPTQSPRRVSLFMVRISSVCLRSRRRWNITRSDQRIWMNHSAVWGNFSLRGRVTAWLDFPLSGAILCNVSDTTLKQPCHSLLSGSIFSYWHFPAREERMAAEWWMDGGGPAEKKETGDGIFQSAWAADINMVLCYPDRETERPLSAGSLVSRSFDTGGVTYQTARSNTRQQFINYALELSTQAFRLSWERLSVQFARAGTTTHSACCLAIHHKAFPSSIRRWRVMDAERLRLPFFLRLWEIEGTKIAKCSPLAFIHLKYAASLKIADESIPGD